MVPDVPADAVPASLLTGAVNRALGVNPALARRAVGPTTGPAALAGTWLVPGTDALDLVLVPPGSETGFRSSGIIIDTVESAVTRGGIGTLGGFGGLRGRLQVLVHGVMPDGVKTVTVRRRGGKTVRIRVRHNTLRRVVLEPYRATWTVAGKRRSTKLVAPCRAKRGQLCF